MGSEGSDKQYLERTQKIAERRSFPSEIKGLLKGEMVLIEDTTDVERMMHVDKLLTQPFSKEPWAKRGTYRFTTGNVWPNSGAVVDVDYDSDIGELKHVMAKIVSFLEKAFEPYRRLRNVKLASGSHTLDSFSTIDKDWSVYMNTAPQPALDVTAAVYGGHKVAVSFRPITSPIGLYGLMHELGHVREFSKLSPKESEAKSTIRRKEERLTPEEKKIILVSERRADAFALRHLNDFFDAEAMALFRKLAYTGQSTYHESL